MGEEIKFGIMCKGDFFQKWQAEAIEKLLGLPGVKPALLIINDLADQEVPEKKGPLYRRALSRLRYFLQRLCRGKLISEVYFSRARPKAVEEIDLSQCLAGVPRLTCRVIRKGYYSEYFREEDIAAIRGYELDFILRFHFGIVRGEILELPRYGVWSFHHDDPEVIRGGPPCFWEIYLGHSATGAILQKLSSRLDGGLVLKKGFFQTMNRSYEENLDRALFGTTDWPRQLCVDIKNSTAGYFNESTSPPGGPVYYAPTNLQMIRYFMILALNRARHKYIRKREKWNVGIVRRPVQDFLQKKPEVEWLAEPPRDRFFADPFVHEDAHGMAILFEDFSYPGEKGVISSLGLEEGSSVEKRRRVIEEPHHLSYPYVFTYEGVLYCVPESGDAGEVRLYRYSREGRRWERKGALLKGRGFIDSTIFEYGGFWWLFCSLKEADPGLNLFAWYASEPCGHWMEHSNNPIKTDIRSARPAGAPFRHRGSLYRPGQDCSESYGGRVVISRIVELSPSRFKEEFAAAVGPYERSPYPDGLHTLSGSGSVTVIDGRKDLKAVNWDVFYFYRAAKKLYRMTVQRVGKGSAGMG